MLEGFGISIFGLAMLYQYCQGKLTLGFSEKAQFYIIPNIQFYHTVRYVYLGGYNAYRFMYVCVCYTYIEDAGGDLKYDFLQEINVMKKVAEGSNPFVVNMVGCSTTNEPLALVMDTWKLTWVSQAI